MEPVPVTASQLSLYLDRDERSKVLPSLSLQEEEQGQLLVRGYTLLAKATAGRAVQMATPASKARGCYNG